MLPIATICMTDSGILAELSRETEIIDEIYIKNELGMTMDTYSYVVQSTPSKSPTS